MFTRKLSYPLEFSQQDKAVKRLEDLANQMRVSRSFLRICLDAGCPLAASAMSAERVLLWLFDHYEQVRALAGLRVLVPVDELPPAIAARLRMANALVTLLEHARTRATNWKQKRQLRQALEQVDRLADRAS